MGVIYKALDSYLNRLVAIKVIHEQFSDYPSLSVRFLREARAMARLDHENIVTIHAVEEERGTPYIVMEYFAGTNLRAFMRERKRLLPRTSVEIILQVADALAYAHGQASCTATSSRPIFSSMHGGEQSSPILESRPLWMRPPSLQPDRS